MAKKVGSFLLLIFMLFSCNKQGKKTTGSNQHFYTEKHRPQYHFSPEKAWMNDPNGLVYKDGEYHLFYQYYPDSIVWGPMHWGHAISKDLLGWKHMPIALYPDDLGYIFSGSAVVDIGNTSGLGTSEKDALIAIFTHHNMKAEKAGSNTFQYQSIAFSNDNGRTFTKYVDNPVIQNPGIRDFRDPKVFWHDSSKKWIMVFAAFDRIRIYNSSDLKNWSFQSEFGQSYGSHSGLWECPDLFPLKVEGRKEELWVLLQSINPGGPNGGSATQYFVGTFDGMYFKLDPDFEKEVINGNAKWIDYGKDNYASVTWTNLPKNDERRICIGWMSNWQYAQVVPTEKWRSAMTLPRELSLQKENKSLRLISSPIKELKSLQNKGINLTAHVISRNERIMDKTELANINLSFEKPSFGKITIRFSNDVGEFLDVGYDADSSFYFVDRSSAGKSDFSDDFSGIHKGKVNYSQKIIEFNLYLDKASLELFADGGKCVMTEVFFPNKPFNKAEILGNNKGIMLKSGQIFPLSSIW